MTVGTLLGHPCRDNEQFKFLMEMSSLIYRVEQAVVGGP